MRTMVVETILSGPFSRIELIESNRQVGQMTEAAPDKTMTEGEAGLAMAFCHWRCWPWSEPPRLKTPPSRPKPRRPEVRSPAVHHPDAGRSTQAERRVLPRGKGRSSERDAGGVRALA